MTLIPFSQIDEYGDEEELKQYTPEQIEAASLLSHIDWEGGIIEVMYSDGIEIYPEELRFVAQEALDAFETLHNAVVDWAEERGVSY